MPLPFPIDFKNPDYIEIFDWKVERLRRIRENPACIAALLQYYKTDIAQFIIDWGMTYDPRNVAKGRPTIIPFVLFPKQEELVRYIVESWKKGESFCIDKSREMGISWLCVAVAVSICLLYEGIIIGFGSRKEEYVDRIGDPKCLFYKCRQFMRLIPVELRGVWNSVKHAPHMRVTFPNQDSIIIGEAGDNIGRGGRTSIYFLDEAAWVAHPELIEAALSETTTCRIDVSTPHGPNNPFAYKKLNNKVPFFSFHWRDDPRKDEAWYKKRCDQIGDPVIIAQELDLDYHASLEGVLISPIWVRAAVDAHIKLGIKPTGIRQVGFDVAGGGKDLNAVVGRHGILIENLEEWSGKDDDIYYSVERAFTFCDINNYKQLVYDSDGLGAGVKGDARKINESRTMKMIYIPFIASSPPINPGAEVFPENAYTISYENPIGYTRSQVNEDFFANYKAQAWWDLRQRFQWTFRVIQALEKGEKLDYNPDNLISISSTIPKLTKLISELSQPVVDFTKTGKMFIDKVPEGALSPNSADAVMMAFAPQKRTVTGWYVNEEENTKIA